MKLELKEMKLAKVEITKNEGSVPDVSFSAFSRDEKISDKVYGIKYDINILNPTSFALNIQRNLSVGWYKERPELEVSGRLKSIELNLIASDYAMLMEVLAKNMTEGNDERIVVVAPTPKPAIGEFYFLFFPNLNCVLCFRTNLEGGGRSLIFSRIV